MGRSERKPDPKQRFSRTIIIKDRNEKRSADQATGINRKFLELYISDKTNCGWITLYRMFQNVLLHVCSTFHLLIHIVVVVVIFRFLSPTENFPLVIFVPSSYSRRFYICRNKNIIFSVFVIIRVFQVIFIYIYSGGFIQ